MKRRIKHELGAIFLALSMLLAPTCDGAARSVRAVDLSVARGQTNRLSVVLESQGDENTLAFSLCYDPSLLAFLEAVRGSDATNAGTTLIVDADQVASGQIGVTLALPSGQAFDPAGSKTIVQISFQAVAGATTLTTPVALCDLPIGREVLAVSSDTLPASYSDATVTLIGICTYSLGINSVSFGASAASDAVSVTADDGCNWSVANTNNWITISSATNGTGNGTVLYTVAPNPTGLDRTGVVAIADQFLSVSQAAAPCTFTLGSSSQSYGFAASAGQVSVTTPSGCSWSVLKTNTWITITTSSNNTNSGTVIYTVAANPAGLARTGVVAIADQFLSVSQAAAPCTFALGSTSQSYGFGAGAGQVSVTTLLGCAWSVLNTNDWITISAAASHTNSAFISYTVAANPTGLARTGLVAIADQFLSVIQAGAPCAFALGSSSQSYGFGANTGQVSVTTLLGCPWSVLSTNSWITITSSPNNTNSGTVSYTVAANPAGLARSGVVAIANQFLSVSQAAAPCIFALAPASWVHRAVSETGMVSVTTLAGCPWSVVNTNTWASITSATNGTGSGTFGYAVTANPTSSDRTGVMTVADQQFTITQVGTACAYKLSPTNRFHGFGAATNTVSMTTGSGCAWNVLNTNSWITILSGASGSGNGSVTYSVTANRNPSPRLGVLNVAGEILALTQWGTNCAFALAPSSGTYSYGAATGLVTVTASSSSCAWNVVNTNDWVLTSITNAAGNGSIGYSLAPNPTPIPRTGVLSIGGQIFALSQLGVPCTFALSSSNDAHGFGSETGLVSVVTSNLCPWSVTNINSWITITSGLNGSGSGRVSYTVDANPTALVRTGVVTIADQALAVSQAGAPCTFTISPTAQSYGTAPTNGQLAVTTLIGCAWNALNTNSWITITSSPNGANSGSISFTVDGNPSPSGRTGVVLIGGQLFTVSQAGIICAYALTPASRSHGFGAETGLVSVTTSNLCAWSSLNTNSWIRITSNSNGTGNASVGYSVDANPTASARTGVVMIAGQFFTINQGGAPCTFAISPLTSSYGADSTNGAVSVTSVIGCGWTVSNSNNWITITSGSAGTNNGSVSYMVAANLSPSPRTGAVIIAGQLFTVHQAGFVCNYALAPPSRGHGAGAETGLVNVTTTSNCTWSVLTTNSWITITSSTNGTGTGTVTYAVAANFSPNGRTGTVTMGDQLFTVNQAGITCAYALSPASWNHGFSPETGLVSVTTSNLCPWIVLNTNSWLAITSATNGIGNGSVSYSVATNAGLARSGTLVIAGQVFTVNQAGGLRLVQALNTSVARNLTNCLSIVFESKGDENALGFSLSYDTNLLTYISARLGSGALSSVGDNAFLNRNTTGVSTGQIAFALALPAGEAFSPGPQEIVLVCFRAASGITTVTTPVMFSDQPIPREISRTNAVSVSAVYSNATVTIIGSCAYALAPSSVSYSSDGGGGAAGMVASNGCPWIVLNTNIWITITSGTNGTSTGTVSYAVAPNFSPNARTGGVMIADQLLTVSQAGIICAYALSPASRTHGFGAETGLVSVTTSNLCAWSVLNTNSWVTITSGTNGTGNASVGYSVAANASIVARTGTVMIGDQLFTVNQAAAPCTFSLSPTSRVHGFGSETGLVGITTLSGCSWSVTNNNPWITISSASSGAGNGNLTYSVAPNPAYVVRTGVVMIANQPFTVSQLGIPCTYALSPTNWTHGYGAETELVSVVTSNGCNWTVSNSNSWVTISSGTNGLGSGNVSYTVAANPSGLARTGVVMIANQPFTVSQAGSPCTFAISPTSWSHGFGVETNQVTVATFSGCGWTVSNGNTWITIASGTNGLGSGTVSYTVAANPISIGRTGVVTIAGQIFAVSQAGVPCTFALSPTSRAHGAGSETGLVSVTAIGGCNWMSGSSNNWISFTTSTNGTGSGSIGYLLAPNPTALARTGVVMIANQLFTVTQAGALCSYTLSPVSRVHGSGSETGLVGVTTISGCAWSAFSSNSWITITSSTNGTGNGTLVYSLGVNSSSVARTGVVMIADQLFTVSQAGALCAFALSPTNGVHGSGAETGLVTVTTINGCSWLVSNTNTWITITSTTNNTGSGSVRYLVDLNPNLTARTGIVSIASQPFAVSQAGAPCTYLISPSNHLHNAGSETGLVSVATSSGCSWAVFNTNSWVIIKAGATGTNNGIVKYTVAANPNPSLRSGVMIVAGQPFTVSQVGTPCAYSLLPTNLVHGSAADTGVVSVYTVAECGWTVVNTNTWITLTSITNGLGNGNVTYAVAANLSPTDRTGLLNIAGLTFTVTQLGSACTFTLAPTNRVHGYGTETGLVSVTTFSGCSWTVSKTNSWITITSSTNGSGNGSFGYTVASNSTALVRTGVITVSGKAFTVSQSGAPCTDAISLTNRVHGAGAETGLVSVASLIGCNWTVNNSNSWINITSGTNGTGSANMTYSVSINPIAIARTGVVMVAGQLFTVSQLGATCTFAISPNNRAHSFGAATGTVTLTTISGCNWTVNNTNTWLNITSVTNAINSGIVSYTVVANPTALPRTGVVMIATQAFTVSQTGAPCTFAIFPTNRIHGSGSETGTVSVASLIGCNWTVNNTNSWISITSGTNGAGTGAVTYTLAPNPNPNPRIGILTIAGQSFTVTNLGGVSLICPPNKIVECATPWDFDIPTASSGCGGTNVALQALTTATNRTGSCGNTFTAIRAWLATDPCSNSASCSQTVRVVDTTPPALSCPANKTVEAGAAWSFDAPTATDVCSSLNIDLQVISTVTNTVGFCGNAFAATQTWQAMDGCGNRATCSQIVNAVDTTAPVLSCAGNKVVVCGTAWSFDAPSAVDAAGGASLTITILGTVTNGNCSQTFTATRTWSATDQCGNSSTCSQSVTSSQVVIAGTVFYPTNYPASGPSDKPLASLPIYLTGDASQSTQTASDGTYSFTVNGGGNFTVTPNLPNGNPVANGVTTVDISLIRRHILNPVTATLDSYKLLAADVNGSKTVTTLDISWIRKLILGATNIFPAGLWRLVPADYVFQDVQNPWDAPVGRSYTNLLADSGSQDFLAIKLGDVNNTWTPPPAGFSPLVSKAAMAAPLAQVAGPEVIFQVSRHTNQPGDTVVAQVTVGAFRQVTSAQFTLAWDSAVLRYEGAGNYGLNGLAAGNFGALLTNSGKLAVSWDDPDALGVAVADGTAIFSVRFEVIGNAGDVSPLALVDNVTVREVGVNFAPAAFRAQNGQVTVDRSALSPLAQPKLTQAVSSKDAFSVSLPTLNGQHYILEFTDALPGANWTALPAVTGDGTVKVLTGPVAATRQRFYRIRIE